MTRAKELIESTSRALLSLDKNYFRKKSRRRGPIINTAVELPRTMQVGESKSSVNVPKIAEDIDHAAKRVHPSYQREFSDTLADHMKRDRNAYALFNKESHKHNITSHARKHGTKNLEELRDHLVEISKKKVH